MKIKVALAAYVAWLKFNRGHTYHPNINNALSIAFASNA
jgi:hypothetical protein